MMRNLTQFDLIRQNLRRKPVRTCILAAVVALFAFTLFCGTILGNNVGNGTRMLAERLGADLLFVPYGYDAKVQNSLLRGEPSSFYMDSAFAAEVRSEPGVDKVTTQLFIATLKAACCTLPVQLIGIDPQSDFVVRPWIFAGKTAVMDRPLAESEVLVGSKIVGSVGDTILLFGKEFTVAARLESTGMGFDTSVFMDLERARRLLLLSELGPHLNLPEGADRNSFVSSTLIKVAPGVDVKDTANAILQKYAIKYNLDFVMVAGMISDISVRLGVFSGIFYAFSAVLWLLAVIVMALVFSAIIQERKKEFGLLRIIGASRATLARIVLKEAFLVSLAGSVIGLGCAGLILFAFGNYIDSVLQLPTIGSGPLMPALTALGVFTLGLLTGPLACLPAIRKLGRADAYASTREDA